MTTFTSTAQRFTAGNYTAAALQGQPGEWQTQAALGLMGKAKAALEGLSRFDHPEARFYEAVANWIEGDESRAIALLAPLQLAHAQNLLGLIRKKKINVLAQLDRGSQWDFITALQNDPKFAIRNVGFKQSDTPNKPYADVHEFYDGKNPPDFYVAKLVEWHVLPPNLQELPCPILGHTADYDIHIQTVYPWLQLFDELVVTDHTEWDDVSRLVQTPVSTFPKAFGLAKSLPPTPTAPRPVDVFISGTAMHPYHPDKARLLHQVLSMSEPAIRFINGFLGPDQYLELLGQTKIGFTYVRHPGAMPTRGLESLAMGAAIAVQEGSVLQLFLGEPEGVVTYDLEKETLPEALRRILSQWPDFEQRARLGAKVVRQEFDVARVAAQYFRFLTFLAARPRGPRQVQSRACLDQKRSILLKGWIQGPQINREIREQSLARWATRLGSLLPSEGKTFESSAGARDVIDMTRELMLEYATAAYPPVARDYSGNFQVTLSVERELLSQALELYRLGARRFPRSLVLRFNWIRAALHFGECAEVSEALRVAEETLQSPASEWQIDVMEDVFPWDYFSQFFNYRAYFDACTLQLQTHEPVHEKLTALILGSIHYYLSFYTREPAPALAAVKLDSDFPFYKLRCARQLIHSGKPDEYPIAASFLADLVANSMLFLRAFEELQHLRDRGLYLHPRFDELSAKVELAKERIFAAGYGVEDWDAIPLRLPMADVTAVDSSQSSPTPHPGPLPVEGRGEPDHARHVSAIGRPIPCPALASATARARRSSLDLDDASVATPSPLNGERAGVRGESNNPSDSPRILFLPLEIADWKQAKHLGYPTQLGLEEGLAAQGVDFLTLPMIRGLSPAARKAWLRQVQQRCQSERFDQVWVEIVHSEWDEDSLRWLAELAPKRVGFLMESLTYDEEGYALDPRLRIRQALVENRLKCLTHLVAVDETDVSRLNERGLISAMWWPQTVPERCIGSIPGQAPDHRALFYGQLYGTRQAWLDSADLRRLLLRPDQAPEDAASLPPLFDSVNRAFAAALESGAELGPRAFADHADALRKIRREVFRLWLAALQNGCGVVNLPSLFSGYAGRV
ncbi:MAG: hypothetical protein L0Z50_20750, partial [Verrucomicrobiales bacterium]|nr:hypothetical protein [Verrucomicrobiales bacterium]